MKKIIDFRFRPNTLETVNGIKNSKMFAELCKTIDFDKMPGQTLDEIVAEMKETGIEKAVITGRDCETTYGGKSNNESLFEFCGAYPDMFLGFYGIDPHKGMSGLRALEDAVKNGGMKGAACDPYLAQIYPNDAKFYPFYAKCCELEIPIVFTTGPATFVPNAVIDHVAPRYIDFVARDFPELKIIMSHGGYPWVNEAIFVAQRNKNVFIDLSEYEKFPQAEAYVQAANTVIADKVLYASAHPFVHFKDALKVYDELDLTDAVRENIMYNNAARVLGLSN